MSANSSSPSSQPLLDLQRLVVTIRRRRRLWLSFALLGFLAGAFLTVAMPTPPTAVTRLMVIHEGDSTTDSGTLMETDVAVLQTARIASQALERLGSSERPEVFLRSYEATGLTNNVMELTAEGRTATDAVNRAKALADTFIADHVRRVQANADAEAQALLGQRERLQQELRRVDDRIATLTAQGTLDSAPELETLYGRRAELTAQVSDLSQRAQEAGIGTPRVTAGTQIVDAPRPVRTSLLVAGLTNSGIGLLLGLVAGLGLAAVTSIVRDRPVLRREISGHLGASVIAQVPAPHRGPSALWRRSRAVAERKRVAVTVSRLVRDGGEPASLLTLGCPDLTAALALDIAGDLAASGGVLLVDDLPDRQVGKLADASDERIHVVEVGNLPQPAWPAERYLGVGSAGPGTAWTDLMRLGTETVLVVRAGHANTEWLHTVARQLADSGIAVIGVVLVGPDPKDRSDGTLWDGLHTALRGRAGRGQEPPRSGVPLARKDGTADHPTETFAPVRPPASGNGESHNADLPTKRFAPVKPGNLEVP